jgi:hypothetical protein
MALRDAFSRPKSYGVEEPEHITLNPSVQSMGFTGITSILIPFNQELFDKLGEATEEEEIKVAGVKLFDAWNHEIDNSLVKNPVMTCSDRFMFRFKCEYKTATNGILESNFWRQPYLPRGINPTAYM